MSSCSALKRLAVLGLFAGIVAGVSAQNVYSPQGGEYPIAGSLPGDQVFPHVALGSAGGYVAWQDNVTDGDGWGISARRVVANLAGSSGVFRVNEQNTGDQENVRVAMLKDGGAVFVWQGGPSGFQHIYARFLKADGTFATGEVLVNTYVENHQVNPAVAVLVDGSVVVAWSSYGQDGDLYGIYAQRFSSAGVKLGAEFQVHQITSFSQRTPAVAALSDGGFVAAWISDRSLGTDSNGVVRYTAGANARRFDASGNPKEDEFQLNTGTEIVANPVVCASPNGGFGVAWSRKENTGLTTASVVGNSWDVYGRFFDAAGNPLTADLRINSYTYGDQFAPRIESLGTDYLVVWTSIDQDGSREGIYGEFVTGTGQLGGEFRVNSTTVSQQLHPAVASDGVGRFLVVWSGFIGGTSSFDLFAQRFAAGAALPAPAAPFVYAPFTVSSNGVYQPQLQVSWPEMTGFTISAYDIFLDGASTPAATTATNTWLLAGLAPSTTYHVQVDYVTADGHRSPVSTAAGATTWSGANFGGIPFEWMTAQFGSDVLSWPRPGDDSDGDGASNLQEFQAGTVPTDPNSVMRVQLVATVQGTRLGWNAQPGSVYQVQVSDNLGSASWRDLGAPRFATGAQDTVPVAATDQSAYYRVIRLR